MTNTEVQNDNKKQELINQLVETVAANGQKVIVETEVKLRSVFGDIMEGSNANSKEYKNAREEFDKQSKVIEYFESEEFKDLYVDIYKQEMQAMEEFELEYLLMQQNIATKVETISSNISQVICDIAENISGETQFNA